MLFPDDKLVKNCKKCGYNIIIDKEELGQKEDDSLYCANCGNFIEIISSEGVDDFFYSA